MSTHVENERGGVAAEEEDPAVLQMCEELGIDLVYEKPLVWVVSLGVSSPLPPRWTAHEAEQEDGSVAVYYVDGDTQQSQWDSPRLPYIKLRRGQKDQ